MAGPTVRRVGAYPGTFDPPTVAHLAVAGAAWRQGGLDAVHLVVSRAPLGKDPTVPSFEDRVAVLEEVAATRPWLEVRVTDGRLIAEVAAGYDAVIMGLDKWLQVVDPVWYGGSEAERDRAVASLPHVLLADRHHPAGGAVPAIVPPAGLRRLEVDDGHRAVSSTSVRAGRREWMAAEAARFDAATGAWSDPERYRRLRAGTAGPAGGDAVAPAAGTASLTPMPGQTPAYPE